MTESFKVPEGMVSAMCGLPSFGGGPNTIPYAKLHSDHFHRLCAVLDAARTGNSLLIRLAVEHQDRFGFQPSSKKEQG